MRDDRQMKMAFMDDGASRDPVSGNEVPTGALAKEVRDDVDAKLSEGEYVVDAATLRYHGIQKYEKLRNQAQAGLESMEADGRVGGSPAPGDGELTEEEMAQILAMVDGDGGSSVDDQTVKMFKGGYMGNQGDTSAPFNPFAYNVGFSVGFRNPYSQGSFFNQFATQDKIEYRTYVNAAGEMLVFKFINGELAPNQTIPEGFYPEGSPIPKPEVVTKGDNDDGPDMPEVKPNAWMDRYDYSSAEKLAQSTAEAMQEEKGPVKILSAGIFGALGGLSTYAQVNANIELLKKKGYDTTALEKQRDEYLEDNKIASFIQGVAPDLFDGDMLANNIRRELGPQWVDAWEDPTRKTAGAFAALGRAGMTTEDYSAKLQEDYDTSVQDKGTRDESAVMSQQVKQNDDSGPSHQEIMEMHDRIRQQAADFAKKSEEEKQKQYQQVGGGFADIMNQKKTYNHGGLVSKKSKTKRRKK